ncbi:MAG: YihY family inner membrane protein [Alphaproteobacteria bacterium]|nr:YihY family inner membrane protein [Alphaproteobacteria bacterium]
MTTDEPGTASERPADARRAEPEGGTPTPSDGRAESRPGPFGFLTYTASRFFHDGCQQRAASLTFTSLLAMVPMLAVSFAIFEAFPAYSRMKDRIQTAIFENFVPAVGEAVQENLQSFTARTGELTAVGILFLIVSAVMLLVSISSAFDTVWRARRRRNLVARLLVFWAVITLAPMLFGASLTISSYLFTVARQSGVEEVTGPLTNFGFLLPFLLQTAGFTALFVILPNHPVRKTDALLGGAAAAVAFELLKKGFGLYVLYFPTYQTIYGALATIPIFLLWVYLSWIIVLFAAELTAALPEWRSGARRLHRGEDPPHDRLACALAMLSSLKAAQAEGRGIRERRLLNVVGFGPGVIGRVTRTLEQARYIARGEKGEWLLIRDLDAVSLHDLYEALGLSWSTATTHKQSRKAWSCRVRDIQSELSDTAARLMDISLAELLKPARAGEFAANDIDEAEDAPEAENLAREDRQARTRLLSLLGLGVVSAGS